MLSRPPEKREMAFTGFFVSADDKLNQILSLFFGLLLKRQEKILPAMLAEGKKGGESGSIRFIGA